MDLDLEHADLVRHVNVIPDAEVCPALSYHHVALWDPLDIGTIVEQGTAGLRLHIIQVQLWTGEERDRVSVESTITLACLHAVFYLERAICVQFH